ncbi:MAG: cytochrome b [Burkholderiales bacterium]|nr:cytochrome b [Burkholderiales bacterium]
MPTPTSSPPPTPPVARDRAARYDPFAVGLHWLLALGFLAMLVLGSTMTGLPLSPTRLKLYNWHKWAGVSLLALSLLRVAWRLTHLPPPAPPMPAWQHAAMRVTHAAFYALFFAVPLAGWSYSSAAGFPVVLFGVWPLPDFVPADRELAEAIKPLHATLAYTLAVTIAVHVLAAFKHQFVDRDGLLARMSFARSRNPRAVR